MRTRLSGGRVARRAARERHSRARRAFGALEGMSTASAHLVAPARARASARRGVRRAHGGATEPPRGQLRARNSASASASSSARDDDARANLAVFVSGGGSNMRAIHDACERGEVRGRVACVVTNAATCGGAEWARERGIPVLIYPAKKNETGGLTADALVDALTREHGVEFVLLAGYLRLIPPELCRAYENRMVNIHPALLPAFGGKGMHGENVHKAVVASGARFTGPTIHFVNEAFDEGKILAQTVVPVFDDDDASAVAARVLAQEHILFPRVVAAMCEDRIRFRSDGVPFIVDAE